MAKPLRFGLVGCGVISGTHAEAIAGQPDAELIAVADENPARAEKLAAQYGARAYSNLQEMLDREQLDAVTICSPSGLHGEQACQVMRSGRHVLVEKPMDLRRDGLDEMVRVQQETGVKLAVISQHRFDPASQQVHDLIAAGAFGRLVLGNAGVAWWRSQAYYDSGAWRGTRALDGGVLMNQAIHTIDVLQWLMGPVRTVYAFADTLSHRMESEDVAVAVLRFANGALGTIAATTGSYPGDLTRIEICGNQGSAVIENDKLAYLRVAGDDAAASPAGSAVGAPGVTGGGRAPVPAVSGHARQVADLIRAIREDGTPEIDGQAGRQPVDLILAIYESARTGQEVRLP
jgi:UDP-N-acetyl-2-amino-2-deoxyglucuronate dehydrogenase